MGDAMRLTDDIELIDLAKMTVTMASGEVLPITDMFDSNDEECEPDEAVMVVAGTDDYGWIDVEVSREKVTVH